MARENCGPGPLVSVCAEDPAPQGQEELGQAGPLTKPSIREDEDGEEKAEPMGEGGCGKNPGWEASGSCGPVRASQVPFSL